MNSLNNSELDSIKTDLFKNYKVSGYDEALNEINYHCHKETIIYQENPLFLEW